MNTNVARISFDNIDTSKPADRVLSSELYVTLCCMKSKVNEMLTYILSSLPIAWLYDNHLVGATSTNLQTYPSNSG